jgi:hypothetical protein
MPLLWLPLFIKAVLTTLVVVSAAVLAEAFGPFWGALIASLPVSAGPAYVFLAMSHDARFVAASALSSLAANAATGAFLIVYAVTVRRLPGWSGLGAAVATWLGASLAIRQIPWTPAAAVLLNLVVYGAGHFICRTIDPEPARPRPDRRCFDLPLRAVLVATFVCGVVVASSVLGPEATGIAAVFPISLGSLIVMLQPRLGASASALLATNAMRAMFGFGLALLALHLSIELWGTARALTTALLVTIAWSGVLLARRCFVTPRIEPIPRDGVSPRPCVRSQLS